MLASPMTHGASSSDVGSMNPPEPVAGTPRHHRGVEAEGVVGSRKRVPEVTHPRGRDVQRATRLWWRISPQIRLALPSRKFLLARGPEQLDLCVHGRRAQVLDLPRPLRGPHDLDRGLARGSLDRPDVGHRATPATPSPATANHRSRRQTEFVDLLGMTSRRPCKTSLLRPSSILHRPPTG